MANVEQELLAFKNAKKGEDVRDALCSAIRKINTVNEEGVEEIEIKSEQMVEIVDSQIQIDEEPTQYTKLKLETTGTDIEVLTAEELNEALEDTDIQAEMEDIRVPASGFEPQTPYTSAGQAVRGQVTALNEKIEDVEDDVDSLSAEVVDARTGYNGTVYNSLGNAIRTQVSNLKNALITITNSVVSNSDFTQGGYVSTTGAVAVPASTTRIRLKNSTVLTDKTITKVTCNDGYSFAVFCWADSTFLGKWNGSDFGTLQWHTSLNVAGAWENGATKLSIQLSKGSNHDQDLTPEDSYVVTLTKEIPSYKEDVENLENNKADRIELDLNTVLIENGGINQSGVETTSTNRVRTKYFLSGDYEVVMTEGYQLAGVYFYNKSTHAFVNGTLLSLSKYNVVSNGYLTRLTFKKQSGDDIDYGDIKNSLALESIADSIQALNMPVVEFEINGELRNVSQYIEDIDYSQGHTPIIEQVTDLFDSLVTDYSGYVTKADAGAECGLTYPSYANGVSEEGDYEITPQYRTYIYKFVESNNALSNNNRFPKKKVLIISGIHGDEQASPFNAYIFAKSLCQGATDDFKRFRSAFDVYIMPCVNGYGLYHSTRYNANGVNINRNYPVSNWTESGEPYQADYTGSSAGSEFETQVVTGITGLYDFVACFDHHNYAHQQWQFFCQVSNTKEMLSLAYRSLVDCSIVFEKDMPQYFGNGYKILVDSSTISTAPGYVNTTGGTACRWWTEQNINHSATIEISDRINYENGQVSATGIQRYSADTFAVADYTLWSQIFRYCQETLR